MSGGPESLLHSLIGLERGQAEEVVENLLVIGQLEAGVGSEAGLEVGGLGGVDGDHSSQQELVVAGTESTETLTSVC